MKTEDILNLDYRKEENQEAIQRVLRKIKPLSKFSEDENIPFEKLEKLIGLYQNKYAIKIQYIMPNYEGSIIYSASLLRSDNFKWIGNVYGMCMYELFAKIAIKMYTEIKKGIPEKSKSDNEKEREKIVRQIER